MGLRLLLVGAMLALSGAASADLRTTPHNLMRYQGLPAASDADELCVFCHTPSYSDAASAGAAPRWQRTPHAPGQFGTYDDMGAGDVPAGRVGSHSVVCLSCHDAAQAPSASMPTTRADQPGITFDHPYGVPYRGASRNEPPLPQDATLGERARRARSVVTTSDFRPATRGVVNGRSVWWVPVAGGTARGRADLPFFPGPGEGGDDTPLIECGTCHDPHSPNPLFLRVAASRSAICLSCHAK